MLKQGAPLIAARMQDNPNPHGNLYGLVKVALVVNCAGPLDEAKLPGEVVLERLPL